MFTAERISIRDSKQSEFLKPGEAHQMLHVSPKTFAAFLAEVGGEEERGANGELLFGSEEDGGVSLWASSQSVKLTYTADEWRAFCAGVAAGEFAVPPRT